MKTYDKTPNRLKAEAIYYAENHLCKDCGEPILLKVTEKTSEARRRKFCSRACSTSFANRSAPKRKKRMSKCRFCGNLKPRSRLYCSSECRVFYNSSRCSNPLAKGPKDATSKWRRKMKEKAVEYKGGKCVLCGYSGCLRSLHFHHVDPASKSYLICQVSVNWEKHKEELDKCVLVCSNCHGEIESGLMVLLR